MKGSENQRDVCQYQRVRYLSLFLFSFNLLIYSNFIEVSVTYNIMYKVYISLTHVIYCKMISTIMLSNISITLHNYDFFFHGENIYDYSQQLSGLQYSIICCDHYAVIRYPELIHIISGRYPLTNICPFPPLPLDPGNYHSTLCVYESDFRIHI